MGVGSARGRGTVCSPSQSGLHRTTLRLMLRVLLLDDHPAVLAGLRRLIEAERDMQVVGATADPSEAHTLLDAAPADIVVLDHDLAHADGLAHCLRIKRRAAPPAVVVYAAYASPALALATRAAGAEALVDKADPVPVLLTAMRRAAEGERTLPPTSPETYAAGVARVDDEDLPVLAMLLDGTRPEDIAAAVDRAPGEIAWRAQRIVGKLCPGLRQRPGERAEYGHAASFQPS
jgi:DNA-binding NarL/FixJ family response regulator